MRVRAVASEDAEWVFEVDEEGVTSLEFLPDRPALRTVGSDGMVRCWSLVSGMELEAHREGSATIYATHGSRDGSLVLVYAEHRLSLWDLERSPREVWSSDYEWPWFVTSAVFAGDGEHAPVGQATEGEQSDENELDLVVLANGERRAASRPLRGRLLALCETDAGPVSIAVEEGDLIVTEEWGERRERRCLRGIVGAYMARVSTDGRLLLVARLNCVELWTLADPRWLARIDLDSNEEWVTSVAIAPYTDTVAVGTNTGRVHLYEGGKREDVAREAD